MDRYVKILLPEDYESNEFEGKKIFKPTYEEVLDHGFVGLVDFMGDDESIPEAARVSYGKGTKKVNTNTGLVRYLMRHGHTSPVEMCTFKFHVKAPIFVFRQWHRHRTFCLSGDTQITFETPCRLRSKNVKTAKYMKLSDLFRKWNDNPEVKRKDKQQRSLREFERSVIKKMLLRVYNESTGEFTTSSIEDVIYSGKKQVFQITLENGKKLKCSKDHQLMTTDGWQRLEDAVGLKLNEKTASMTKNAHVLCNGTPAYQDYNWMQPQRQQGFSVVAKPSKIVGIELIGEEDTYDLCVKGPHHNFVADGMVVHNSTNEYSARYSEMSDEMYMPNYDVLFPQSTSNKQGREGNLFTEEEYSTICSCIDEIFDNSYHTYKHILGPDSNGTVTPPPDSIKRRIDWAKAAALEAARTARERALEEEGGVNPYDSEEKVDNLIRAYLQQNGLCELNNDFPGISRELARIVLPVAAYSQMYWAGNLHNLFHFLKLRADSHAQHEIQVYANAILKLITPIVPKAVRAFEDYQLYANKFSRMENEVLKDHLVPMITEKVWHDMLISLEEKGCSNREILEFKSKLGI